MKKITTLDQAIKTNNPEGYNLYFLLAYYNARQNDHPCLILQNAKCMRDIKEIIHNLEQLKIHEIMLPTDFPSLMSVLDTFVKAGFKTMGITNERITVIPIVGEEIFKPVILLRRESWEF